MDDAPSWVTRITPPRECPACRRSTTIRLHQVVGEDGFVAAEWRCTECNHSWPALQPNRS
jgi:predicted Zn finger-like uncharacterized protein